MINKLNNLDKFLTYYVLKILILSRRKDKQVQETFLTSSADKKTRKYDTESSNDHLPQSPKRTAIEPWKDKMVSYIYAKLPTNTILRLPNPQRGEVRNRKRF